MDKISSKHTEHTWGDENKSQTIYYRKPSLLARMGNPTYMPTSKGEAIALPGDAYDALSREMKDRSPKDIQGLIAKYKRKSTRDHTYTLMEPKPVLIGRGRWKDLSSKPLHFLNVSRDENYSPSQRDLTRLETTNYGKMKADYKLWKKDNKGGNSKMDKKAEFKEMIYEYAMEKEAGLLTSALTAGKAAMKAKGLGSAAKATYNTVAKGNIGQKMLTGATLGVTHGALKYDESKDDGTFAKSRWGQMLGSAAGGAVIGGMAHGVLKPIRGKAVSGTVAGAAKNPKLLMSPGASASGWKGSGIIDSANGNINGVQYKVSCLDNKYMEKVAFEIPKNVRKAVGGFVDLSPWQRLAIGAIIGAGTGAAAYKPKNNKKYNNEEDDGMIESLIKKVPGVGKAYDFADKTVQKLDNSRLGSAGKGAIVGSALSYSLGNRKV